MMTEETRGKSIHLGMVPAPVCLYAEGHKDVIKLR